MTSSAEARPRGVAAQFWASAPRPIRHIVAPLGPLAVVALAVLIWWIATIPLGLGSAAIPSPSDVGVSLWNIIRDDIPLGHTGGQLLATLERLFVAFAIAFVIGTAVGVAAGRLPWFFDLVDDILWIFLAVPSIVWVFIFAVAIGLSNSVPIAALVVVMLPLVAINVAEGAKTIPKDLIEMSDAFKVGGLRRILDVYLPFLVPYLASSARVSFALGVRVVTVVEVIGLTKGVGYLLNYHNDLFQIAPIIAWGLILILIGILVDQAVFGPLERRYNR